jgi:hypothetical protein
VAHVAPDLTALEFSTTVEADADVLAALHVAVARDLTPRYGRGHWSYEPT